MDGRPTLEETLAVERIGRVAVPAPVLHLEQAQPLRHLGRGHGCGLHRNAYQPTLCSGSAWEECLGCERTIGQVLLVGKDEQEAVLHLAVVEDLVELGARLVDAVAVLRVDDKDEALCARVVVPPQGPDLVLPADVLCAEASRVSNCGRSVARARNGA